MERQSESLASELAHSQSSVCAKLYLEAWLQCDSGLVAGDARLRFRTHSAVAELQRDLLNNIRFEASERRYDGRGSRGGPQWPYTDAHLMDKSCSEL